MNWDQLLSDRRFGRDDKIGPAKSTETNRTHFEADYDRIIYSEPFRRLSKKTQVHPFPQNDHVRTRLTHSLEVASVGRSLAKRVASELRQRGKITGQQAADLTKVVEAACLAHDIGNPPFGHAGEHAIREWVQANDQEVFGQLTGQIRNDLICDFFYFEGNAQAFRIAARANNPQTGYLRLTLATLATMQKYPWPSSDRRTAEKGKCGFFSTEQGMYLDLARALGLEHKGRVARHPLSFLVEAADDISYSVADPEDAVKVGILSSPEVIDLYRKFAPKYSGDDHGNVAFMRGIAVGSLVDEFLAVFMDDYDAIISGQREKDLKSDLSGDMKTAFKRSKEIYASTIFAERSKIASEIGAYKAIGRIIRALSRAARTVVDNGGSVDDSSFVAKRALELCWDREYLRRAQESGDSAGYAWWLHQILDYIAGLTDDFARRISREIEGV
ncbi:MAG: dGTP triphosphohydrolase [Phycisphaerales bacterium JB050]